jgi:hypothetical protein
MGEKFPSLQFGLQKASADAPLLTSQGDEVVNPNHRHAAASFCPRFLLIFSALLLLAG